MKAPALTIIRYPTRALQLAIERASRFPDWMLGLTIRVGVAEVFWRSGQTKVAGWRVTDSTIALFRDEYKLPLIPPEVAANLAAAQEHLFSALLIVGLASRMSALALLIMTAVIEIFVYPQSWPDHLLWAGSLLYIVARGPGALSCDAFIDRLFLWMKYSHSVPSDSRDSPAQADLIER